MIVYEVRKGSDEEAKRFRRDLTHQTLRLLQEEGVQPGEVKYIFSRTQRVHRRAGRPRMNMPMNRKFAYDPARFPENVLL